MNIYCIRFEARPILGLIYISEMSVCWLVCTFVLVCARICMCMLVFVYIYVNVHVYVNVCVSTLRMLV